MRWTTSCQQTLGRHESTMYTCFCQLPVCCLLKSIYISLYLSIYLSTYLSIYLSIYLSTYLSIYLPKVIGEHSCCIIYLSIEINETTAKLKSDQMFNDWLEPEEFQIKAALLRNWEGHWATHQSLGLEKSMCVFLRSLISYNIIMCLQPMDQEAQSQASSSSGCFWNCYELLLLKQNIHMLLWDLVGTLYETLWVRPRPANGTQLSANLDIWGPLAADGHSRWCTRCKVSLFSSVALAYFGILLEGTDVVSVELREPLRSYFSNPLGANHVPEILRAGGSEKLGSVVLHRHRKKMCLCV